MSTLIISRASLFTCAILFCHEVCFISSFVPAPYAFQPKCSRNDHCYTSTSSTDTTPFMKSRTYTLVLSSSLKEEDNNGQDRDDEQDQRQWQQQQQNVNYSKEDKNKGAGLNGQRESEFDVSEPREITPQHEKRLQDLMHVENTFVPYGDELWQLRSTLMHLSKQLIHMIAAQNQNEIDSDGSTSGVESTISEEDIRKMIREVEQQDPEYVYAMEKEKMEKALLDGRDEDAEDHKKKALIARSALPQFNLHGLWVGNYGGEKGFEMINVTYVGDTLMARKVTGDENVPSGELTFQADLSPPSTEPKSFKDQGNIRQPLSNIILSDKASKKWNTKELPRFVGLGQVAEKRHVNSQWLEGQLVFINPKYFSFSWMSLNHQILFGRPSYDLTMKMLIEEQKKQSGSKGGLLQEDEDMEECSLPPTLDDDYETLNRHVSNCFDATQQLEEECYIQDDSSSCVFYDGNSDDCCFE